MYIFVLRNKSIFFERMHMLACWYLEMTDCGFGWETAKPKSVAKIYFQLPIWDGFSFSLLILIGHVSCQSSSNSAAVTRIGWKCVGVSPYHWTPVHSQTTTDYCGCVTLPEYWYMSHKVIVFTIKRIINPFIHLYLEQFKGIVHSKKTIIYLVQCFTKWGYAYFGALQGVCERNWIG